MPHRPALSAIGPILALAALAALLMVPALRAAPFWHDSFWIDRVWSVQFTAELARGNPYPRWMPDSFGGLGAPVFYFYPPLSFYLVGAFGLAGLGPYPALLAGFAAAWLASGVAMRAWLRSQGAPAPLAGAALYMVLPYHVVDFYARGALAEFCAVALLPLVALALRRTIRARRAWPLALAFAALVMTHLPMAMLTGLLLVAPLGLWETRGRWQALLPVLRGGIAALALASPYLLPALTLQRHSSIASLWSVPFLTAANWSLLTPARWPSTGYVLLFAALAAGTALAVLVAGRVRRGPWGMWTLAICALAVGLVPGIWSLPPLTAVQFPWRALALAEFGLVSALALGGRSPVLVAAMLTPLLTLSFLMTASTNPLHGAPIRALPVPGLQDVIEYLPPGAVDQARVVDEAAVAATSAAHRRDPRAGFPFPSLRARCGDRLVPLVPDPAAALAVRPPPGCTRAVVRLPAERIGVALALVAALLLAMPFSGMARRTFRRRAALPPRTPQSRSFLMVDTSRIQEHMPVIGADGVHVGTVDHLDGDRIKLTRTDSSDGKHHYIATGLIADVDGDTVRLSANADVAISIFEESE